MTSNSISDSLRRNWESLPVASTRFSILVKQQNLLKLKCKYLQGMDRVTIPPTRGWDILGDLYHMPVQGQFENMTNSQTSCVYSWLFLEQDASYLSITAVGFTCVCALQSREGEYWQCNELFLQSVSAFNLLVG